MKNYFFDIKPNDLFNSFKIMLLVYFIDHLVLPIMSTLLFYSHKLQNLFVCALPSIGGAL